MSRYLPSRRRRQRKEQLARRHGALCTYCGLQFVSLRDATLDHIVPQSLFATWSVVHLVLACRSCNQAKADRLPLSIALLLLWSNGAAPLGVQRTGEAFTTDRPVFSETNQPTGPDRPTLSPGEVNWPLLARLVHARVTADQSTPEQASRPDCARRAVRVGRLAHPRRAARLNTCEQPTDRGVSA